MTYSIKILQLEQGSLSQKADGLRLLLKLPNKDIAAQAAVKLINTNNELMNVIESINRLLDAESKETVERVIKHNKI